MQGHKLSSYNTQLSNNKVAAGEHGCVERKVELVKGKAMMTSVIHKPEQNETTPDLPASSDAAGQFDFAGLARCFNLSKN